MSALEGVTVHVAVAQSKRAALAEEVEENGGAVADSIEEADVVVSTKRCAGVRAANDAGKVCVSPDWLSESIQVGEPMEYRSYIIGKVTEEDGDADDEEDEDEEPPRKKPARKKRLNIALAEDTDEETLVPIIKQLDGVICDLTPRLMNEEPLSVFVSGGATHTGEIALATVCGVPVVSEAWVYESLTKGEFVGLAEHQINAEALASEVEPFEDLSVFISGRVPRPLEKKGAQFLIRKGGGHPCELTVEDADLQVVFDTKRGCLGELPAVAPAWLFQSGEMKKRQALQDYLLPPSDALKDDGVEVDDSDIPV